MTDDTAEYILTSTQINHLITGIESIVKNTIGNFKRKLNVPLPAEKPQPGTGIANVEPVRKKPKADWECEGLIWEDPPQLCPKGDDPNFKKKEGCLWAKKRHTICRNCKNALNRKKRQEKKNNSTTNE